MRSLHDLPPGACSFRGYFHWPAGSIIYRGGDKPNLRVVGELEAPDDDPELLRVLIVEPVA
jgi:hypothetical protein